MIIRKHNRIDSWWRTGRSGSWQIGGITLEAQI
jgi:hypothetical protein